jgi:hypothetical protein
VANLELADIVSKRDNRTWRRPYVCQAILDILGAAA